jgi:hypothetical protein
MCSGMKHERGSISNKSSTAMYSPKTTVYTVNVRVAKNLLSSPESQVTSLKAVLSLVFYVL